MTGLWEFEPQLSGNAQTIFEHRYLRKHEGKPIEKPIDLFHRVALAVAAAESAFGSTKEEIEVLAERFYMRMAQMQFLPNSPTLMNAGRDQGQLSACFVLPIPDTMEGIFDALRSAALIHKSGGGTGFDFSQLRPKDSLVSSTGGMASGPVSFMKVFNAATEAVKQGGVRRGANMGILRVDHPDIREFITCKQDGVEIANFNISVGITDSFMNAVTHHEEYELQHNGRSYGFDSAQEIWDLLTEHAWRNGEPGIIFLDRINSMNPVSHLGSISSTNPCGEQPLLPYESCNLGSINLALMVSGEKGLLSVDYDLLQEVVDDAVRFLDNVIEINSFPLPEIREATLKTRKIGLGVMGFADLLFQLNIPYESERAVRIAEEVMSFIQQKAMDASSKLAVERGSFPAWEGSVYSTEGLPLRNATLTTIAPTGSISMLAGCSSGIEPLFALAYTKTVLSGTALIEINPFFAAAAQSEGFYSSQLMEHLSRVGRLGMIRELPEWVRRVFVTAQEISPEAHIAIQTAFQRFTDNAVSKTINFANEATREQVASAFYLAYQQGLKGLTVYRDGSRSVQVYTTGTTASPSSDERGFHRSFNTRGRPEVTKGEIEKFAIGCGSLYVMSSRDDIGLTEVFCEPGKFGGCESQSEATGRLISYCLRLGRSAEEVERIAANIIEQLRGIRCPACIRRPGISVTSCPDAIARSLQRQFPDLSDRLVSRPITSEGQMLLDDQVESGDSGYGESELLYPPARSICPDCGQELIPEGGCWTCRNCGFTKCG
ncbi:MAG: vitamin B12-dependent ribonucleotide reductase [Symbiobacteriaceae bacterium]|nr:vitamin B12-dependent ribonucleotide reductase [Symbiobacteriaceae bacterium]